MNKPSMNRAQRRAEARAVRKPRNGEEMIEYSMPDPWKVLHAAFSPTENPLKERKVFLAMFSHAMGLSEQDNTALQDMLDRSDPAVMALMRDLALMRTLEPNNLPPND